MNVVCDSLLDEIVRPQVVDRQGEIRAERITDDIFTLVKFLDNHTLMPTYVTNDLDMLP